MNYKDIGDKSLDDLMRRNKKGKSGNKNREGKDTSLKATRGKRIGKGGKRFQKTIVKYVDRRNERPNNFRGRRRELPPKRPQNLRQRLDEIRNPEKKRQEEKGAKLFVNNLPMKFKNEELNELFSSIGYLTKCRLVVDDFGKSKGKAVVIFENSDDAKKAVDTYDGNELDGKVISVEFAPEKEMRNERSAPRKSFNGHDSRFEKRRGFPGRRDNSRRRGRR